MAPTMTEVSQRSRMAPLAYVMTVILFSTASHCRSQEHARLLNFEPIRISCRYMSSEPRRTYLGFQVGNELVAAGGRGVVGGGLRPEQRQPPRRI